MASKNSIKAKTSTETKRTPATLRSTSGAGFEFEDLISAWLMMKMLAGEPTPAIQGVGFQLQSQVSALNWLIDDLLVSTHMNSRALSRLAISAKGNFQVSGSGLPADFVTRAWKQWRGVQGPMDRLADGLALVTQGTHQVLDPNWREVKNACDGSDLDLAMARIRGNPKQSQIFDSVQQPLATEPAASDAETVKLIRQLHVLPVDLQLPYSDAKDKAIAQGRLLLTSGDMDEAKNLWQALVNIATEVRISQGSIALTDLWSKLRKRFGFRLHPDFESDWQTLSNLTGDHKARIDTELWPGYSIARTREDAALHSAITGNALTVVVGESGSGKSALVKTVLDAQFGSWMQVWFGAEELATALSAARRGILPLRHELARVLLAATHAKNVLVIDAVEHIDPAVFPVLRTLLNEVLNFEGPPEDGTWHVVLISQTQGGDRLWQLLGGRVRLLVESPPLSKADVQRALWASHTLGWLTAHDQTVAALTNFRTLAWVVSAGAALGSLPGRLASHTSIADQLWDFWTDDRVDLKAIMMQLARREASFERSFALSDLDPAQAAALTPWPDKLPLHLTRQNQRIEFAHDLAADWARFQFLKEIEGDLPQWAALAENPLWTNALRMLGQFLLRRPAGTASAWDAAFKATEAGELTAAGHVLLDALCLDPEAQRFMTERVELLLADNARHLAKLLARFHHIATVPTGGISRDSSLGLYLEARYRTVVVGRWPPMLHFLLAQRQRLRGLVLSTVAKVIQTWLGGTPPVVSDGTSMPFRRDLTDMALAMARTVQVQKGEGVIYADRETIFYTAPLSGAGDAPVEIGAWALELAGRKPVDLAVAKAIADARRQAHELHQERLRTDAKYKARHQTKRPFPPSIGSFRSPLPAWPLGASSRVDMDFRAACLKESGLQPLMHACPDLAAEVLLALLIEDQPERDNGSSRHEIELGLQYSQDTYPTAFWKSPFFSFLAIAPDAALGALIALVNFSTERWVAAVTKGRPELAPGIALQLVSGEQKHFAGGWSVFNWTQTDSLSHGQLFCALDALERWLTLQLDAASDVTASIERILRDGQSAALVGLLVNVGEHCPFLFSGVLAPLLTDPTVFHWDSHRVTQNGYRFDAYSWARAGEAVFQAARSWTLAPHRVKPLQDVIVELLLGDDVLSSRLQALIPTWPLPEDPKQALEFRLLFAALDRTNYQRDAGWQATPGSPVFMCPAELRRDMQSWQETHAKPLQVLLVPRQCEQFLQAQQALSDVQATELYGVLQACDDPAAGDPHDVARCKLAIAATLIVLADGWLARTSGAMEKALSVVRKALGNIATSADGWRDGGAEPWRDGLKFAAYATTHLWMHDDGDAGAWEPAVLRLLTSGDSACASTVVGVAQVGRSRLGPAWWRLLQAGVLWSGLTSLMPRYGDAAHTIRTWDIWLARLRRFPLRGVEANPTNLAISRVALGCERLGFQRRLRSFASGEQRWRREPERRSSVGLDSRVLEAVFSWFLRGPGTGDLTMDAEFALSLWRYETGRAQARGKEDGEYDLPSHLGYSLLEKLAELTLQAPEALTRSLWQAVLSHGPNAHYALRHFATVFFQRLDHGDDPAAFERVWRAIADYALASDWDKQRHWFYGGRLQCDLLGFGNETALSHLASGAALRMQDIYARWAALHLGRDEEFATRFCRFVVTSFGTPLRLDALRWIAAMLKTSRTTRRWYRGTTQEALIELIDTSLIQDGPMLAKDGPAREALLAIAATLASGSDPTALALQERIRLLR